METDDNFRFDIQQSKQQEIKCWNCQYCDKESFLKNGKWILTRTGYCLAEKSEVNGQNDFYKKVYMNTIYKNCNQFNPLKF